MALYDLHTHTRYSDGLNTSKEMVDKAKEMGLAGIAITDHNVIEGAVKALEYTDDDFLVIPGIEVSSTQGHILCLGIEEKPPEFPDARELIDWTHEREGLVIAAHPFDRLRGGVGDLVFKQDFDAAELYNGRSLLTSRSLDELERKLKEKNIPVVGGSDAHSVDELGKVLIEIDDHKDIISAIKENEVKVHADLSRRRTLKQMMRSRFRFL